MMAVHGLLSCLAWAALACAIVHSDCGRKRRRQVDNETDSNEDDRPRPPAQWFRQRLDNYNPTDTKTWQQRYWVRDDFYQKGGPAFLLVSGEWEAGPDDLFNNPLETYANMSHAKLLVLEHRYYGQSRPTSNMSTENLRYLTSQQALVDVAQFIVAMRKRLPQSTRWIAFGCSYGGSLVSWLRNKYPHLVYAAVASSAPLLAKLDYTEYLDVVKESLALNGRGCLQSVQDAQDELEQLLKTSSGIKYIAETFRLCEPINTSNESEVFNLYAELVDKITETVQYNSYDRDLKQLRLGRLCDILTNSSIGGPLERYATMDREMSDDEDCRHHSYEYHVKKFKNLTMWTPEPGDEDFIGRQWMYQSCSEFGFFQTSSYKQSLVRHHIPLKFYINYCLDIFGDIFTQEFIQKAVDDCNVVYGGVDLEVSRVVYLHGTTDPWYTLGLNQKKHPESPVIFIQGTAHCSDIQETDPSDSWGLIAARDEVWRYISLWLQKSPPP